MESIRRAFNRCAQDEDHRTTRSELAQELRREGAADSAAHVEAFAANRLSWSDTLQATADIVSDDEQMSPSGVRNTSAGNWNADTSSSEYIHGASGAM